MRNNSKKAGGKQFISHEFGIIDYFKAKTDYLHLFPNKFLFCPILANVEVKDQSSDLVKYNLL